MEEGTSDLLRGQTWCAETRHSQDSQAVLSVLQVNTIKETVTVAWILHKSSGMSLCNCLTW